MSSYTNFAVRGSRNRRPRYGSGRPAQNRNKGRKQYIHPDKFIKAAKPTHVDTYIATHTFADFDIQPLLKENIITKGYLTPSPIQDQAIPSALEGKDVIGIANTGTGKTAAFAIPILHRLMNDKSSRAIIIAPTRELAQQIEDECISFARKSGLNGVVLIGGSPMGKQLQGLRNKPNIVIGTPGRIKDHVERRTLDLSGFNMVVLDEVDRMVDMGFINDIRLLLSKVADKRQSLFFSATIDHKINALIQSFMTNPVTVSVKQGDTSDNVEQNVVRYGSSSEKIGMLHDLLIDSSVKKALVFDETQRSVERLSKELVSRGFKTNAIHGGKTQGHRQRALNQFRDDNISVLVATDVAARGIDVTDITHVINYSTPASYDDYIHRIGRAGRAGKTGNALTFIEKTH
ncbi:MAG: DEAD/DEAH box helicase [Candidatus Saccharimonadales bacterium]